MKLLLPELVAYLVDIGGELVPLFQERAVLHHLVCFGVRFYCETEECFETLRMRFNVFILFFICYCAGWGECADGSGYVKLWPWWPFAERQIF